MHDRSRTATPETPPKRPRDFNVRAYESVAILTGTAPEPSAEEETAKDPAAVALGRKGGLKGGKARAAKMSSEERKLSARKAAIARWEKVRQPAS